MLPLAVPQQGHPLDLGELLAAARANPPQAGLTCQGQGWCAGQRVPSILSLAQGQVMFLHLARNLAAVKILSPVTEPLANQPEWPGMEPKCVLAHSANPGHWRAFVKVAGVWWCVDSTHNQIQQLNPFTHQLNPIQTVAGYTVDVIIFSV